MVKPSRGKTCKKTNALLVVQEKSGPGHTQNAPDCLFHSIDFIIYPLRRGFQACGCTSQELPRQLRCLVSPGNPSYTLVREHSPGWPTTAKPDDSDGRTSGLQLQCTTPERPLAAWLGTSGEAGPRTDVRPAHATAEGGPGPEPLILSRVLTQWMVEVQWNMQWTSLEPTGGVMNRLRCCRSSDSDGRSLQIAGPGQHAGLRHSTAPRGV